MTPSSKFTNDLAKVLGLQPDILTWDELLHIVANRVKLTKPAPESQVKTPR